MSGGAGLSLISSGMGLSPGVYSWGSFWLAVVVLFLRHVVLRRS